LRGVDVNVLVYAHRSDAEDHDAFRTWLDTARQADEPLGVSDMVLSGFIRIVTHPRVFTDPTPAEQAWAFAEAVRSSPAAVRLAPGTRHWDIFRHLCVVTRARGNLVPDAFLAAVAIESNATWMTADRGFGRYPGLRWAHPLDQ
jgi:toxin-antitoxin system PIN domain toxin